MVRRIRAGQKGLISQQEFDAQRARIRGASTPAAPGPKRRGPWRWIALLVGVLVVVSALGIVGAGGLAALVGVVGAASIWGSNAGLSVTTEHSGGVSDAPTAAVLAPAPAARFTAVDSFSELEPNWVVGVREVDDSCSGILDYCIRVQCDVFSPTSTDYDTGTIVFNLLQNDKLIDTQRQELHLSRGDSQTLRADFAKSATLLASGMGGQCVLEPALLVAGCTVKNVGDASGTVSVTLKVLLDGTDVDSKTKKVKLSAGETDIVTFEFPPYEGMQTQCFVR